MRRALVLANKIATRNACTAFKEVTDKRKNEWIFPQSEKENSFLPF